MDNALLVCLFGKFACNNEGHFVIDQKVPNDSDFREMKLKLFILPFIVTAIL